MAIDVKALRELDIKSLALNDRFGDLKFEIAYPKLEEIKRWFLEFGELNYEEYLPKEKVAELNRHFEKYSQHLNWLKGFSISTSANRLVEHDNFENQISSFHSSFFENFIVKYLAYLKNLVNARSQDNKALEQ